MVNKNKEMIMKIGVKMCILHCIRMKKCKLIGKKNIENTRMLALLLKEK